MIHQSNLPHLHYRYLILVFIVFLFTACEQSQEIIPMQETENPNINEARAYYQLLQPDLSEESQETSRSNKKARHKYAKSLKWDRSVIKERDQRTLVYVPIQFENPLIEKKRDILLSDWTYILFIKKNKNWKARLVSSMPDSSYLASDRSRGFSGLVIVEKLNRKIVTGFKYTNGTRQQVEFKEEDL